MSANNSSLTLPIKFKNDLLSIRFIYCNGKCNFILSFFAHIISVAMPQILPPFPIDPIDRCGFFSVHTFFSVCPYLISRLPIRSCILNLQLYSQQSHMTPVFSLCLDPIWLEISGLFSIDAFFFASYSYSLIPFADVNIKWLDDYFRFMTLMYWLRMTANNEKTKRTEKKKHRTSRRLMLIKSDGFCVKWKWIAKWRLSSYFW